MKHLLLLISLSTLLSACQRIELGVRQTLIQDHDVPHKTYQTIGNVCQATDGGITTVLLRTASNQPIGSYGSVYVTRSEVAVVKTNSLGRVEWTKLVWAGVNSSYFRPLIHSLDDGGYLIFLYPLQNITRSANQVPLLIHLNSVGEVLTTQPVDAVKPDVSFTAQKILSLADKGFIISGRTRGSGGDLFLMRFDKQGKLQWSRSYGQITNTNTHSMAATSDGGLIFSWSTPNSTVQTQYETSLLRTDANGQQSWFKKYALLGNDPVVSESSDKGYVLLLKNTTNLNNIIVYKLDRDAEIQWVKLYKPANQYVTPLGIFPSVDTHVSVYSVSSGGIELLTTDLAGAEQNRETVSGPSLSSDNSNILRLSDGSFVYAGRALFGAIILVKTKPDKTPHWSSAIATNN